MTENPQERQMRVDREKVLFAYTDALERGDFEAVARLLIAAEGDPEMAVRMAEIDAVYAEEMEAGWKEHPRPAAQSIGTRLRKLRLTWATYALVIVLVLGASLTMLTLVGPAVGNVFSGVVNNLDQGYYGQNEDNWPQSNAIQPTAAAVDEFLYGLPTGTPAPISVMPSSQDSSTGENAPAPVQPQERLIIKNGDIALLVEDADVAVDVVTRIATDNGGYVLSSQTWSSDQYKSAAMTLAVPAENFEVAMRRLRESALDVLRESSTGEDVSGEYVDLESRLHNLIATRDRLRTFLDEAQTVDEALAVNTQLSEIEGQIEVVQGRMNYLSGRAAYSTITVSIEEQRRETPTPTPTMTPPWSLAPRIDNAVETQTNLARDLLSALVWLVIVPGPYLLGIAGIVLVVRWLLRRNP